MEIKTMLNQNGTIQNIHAKFAVKTKNSKRPHFAIPFERFGKKNRLTLHFSLLLNGITAK